MKGFGIEIKNNLLETKHVDNMGKSPVWLYMWLIDKTTSITEEGVGKVLGGKPIKYEEVREDLGIHKNTYSEWVRVLEKYPYIRTKRTGRGIIFEVLKIHKRFTRTGESDSHQQVNQSTEKQESNKTSTVRQYSNILISKDINTESEFGNPQINELSKYLLSVMNIPKEDCTQAQSRRYWSLLLKESKTGIDGVKWLVDLAGQDKFYRDNISSSKDLYYKRVKLIQRKRGSAPKIMM